jgi:hypothetical protein
MTFDRTARYFRRIAAGPDTTSREDTWLIVSGGRGGREEIKGWEGIESASRAWCHLVASVRASWCQLGVKSFHEAYPC